MAIQIEVAARFDPAVHGEIERAADELFRQYFGRLPWDEGAAEAAAVAEHGLRERLLEARAGSVVVGFARLLEAGDTLHLEQLSVLPSHARQGVGGALLSAVLTEASGSGFRAVTLRTFADVPWNAPFYAGRGFRVVREAPSAFHEGLVRTERALGLLQHGERVHMLAAISVSRE